MTGLEDWTSKLPVITLYFILAGREEENFQRLLLVTHFNNQITIPIYIYTYTYLHTNMQITITLPYTLSCYEQ